MSGSQAVNLVVHDNVSQVHIAAHRVEKVIAADPETVSVTAGADHFQFVVAQLRTRGHREGATMKSVHPVSIDEAWQVGGTTDAADDQHLVRLESQLEECRFQRGENGEIAATRTPVGMNLAFVGILGQLSGSDCRRARWRGGFDCGAHNFL